MSTTMVELATPSPVCAVMVTSPWATARTAFNPSRRIASRSSTVTPKP